jgi:hypothetical protein
VVVGFTVVDCGVGEFDGVAVLGWFECWSLGLFVGSEVGTDMDQSVEAKVAFMVGLRDFRAVDAVVGSGVELIGGLNGEESLFSLNCRVNAE